VQLKILLVVGFEVAFVASVVVGVLLSAHTYEDRSRIVGIICIVFGTIMYAAPLTVMVRVHAAHVAVVDVWRDIDALFRKTSLVNLHGPTVY
jgi:hypothetical protein